MRFSGASGRRFPSLFDGGRETSRAATHVEFCDGVLSDAGSNPAASKSLAPLGLCRRRLQASGLRPSGLPNMFESRRGTVRNTAYTGGQRFRVGQSATLKVLAQ